MTDTKSYDWVNPPRDPENTEALVKQLKSPPHPAYEATVGGLRFDIRCLKAAEKIEADAGEIAWLRKQRSELEQHCFNLRTALQAIIDAADSEAAQGGEMWFAGEVYQPIENARAALSKALGREQEEKS